MSQSYGPGGIQDCRVKFSCKRIRADYRRVAKRSASHWNRHRVKGILRKLLEKA